MEGESWRRNHGQGITEEESWRRNHGQGIIEEETWRREHGAGIPEKSHGGGLIEEAPRELSGRPLGTSLETGMVWGGHRLFWARKLSKPL